MPKTAPPRTTGLPLALRELLKADCNGAPRGASQFWDTTKGYTNIKKAVAALRNWATQELASCSDSDQKRLLAAVLEHVPAVDSEHWAAYHQRLSAKAKQMTAEANMRTEAKRKRTRDLAGMVHPELPAQELQEGVSELLGKCEQLALDAPSVQHPAVIALVQALKNPELPEGIRREVDAATSEQFNQLIDGIGILPPMRKSIGAASKRSRTTSPLQVLINCLRNVESNELLCDAAKALRRALQ